MLNAIIESLPVAIGLILATLPLVAIPLILLTRRAVGVLKAFMGGYAAGFLALGGLVILIADLIEPSPSGPPSWMIWFRVALGLALFWLAWRKWQAGAAKGEDAELPGWMRMIDTTTASRAAGLGFLIVVLNPKNSVLVISGALAIASVTYAPLAQAGALVVFTAISGLGVAAPWFMWLAMGERAIAPLDRMKTLMARHNTLVMTAILVVLGAVLILNALNEF